MGIKDRFDKWQADYHKSPESSPPNVDNDQLAAYTAGIAEERERMSIALDVMDDHNEKFDADDREDYLLMKGGEIVLEVTRKLLVSGIELDGDADHGRDRPS